jgi:hypothetical protein
MTRILLIAALCGVTSTAFAAPPCSSYAGLVDADKDGFCAFVGTSTATSTGWTGPVDCRDDIRGIRPGAIEIIGDGIDQDCSGADAVFPVADAVAKRYLANSGTNGPLAFITEYDRCKAATGRCSVDDTAGQFVITNPEVDVFRDVYLRLSTVLVADGVREVVTLEEASHFPGGSGSGVNKAYVDKSVDVLRGETDKLREEILAADEAMNTRLVQVESDRDALVEFANEHTVRLHDFDKALLTETELRKRADNQITSDLVDLETGLTALTTRVETVASHGPLIEVGAVGGWSFRRPLVNSQGDWFRSSSIGGGGFELRAGVDANGWQVAGFGQVNFGSDGVGTGPDMGYLIGSDVLFDVGPVEVGPWAAFVHTEDHANFLDITVLENGGLVGVTVQVDRQNGAARVVPFARFGVGPGFYGSKGITRKGDPVVISDYGCLGLVQAGFRFGAGAQQ